MSTWRRALVTSVLWLQTGHAATLLLLDGQPGDYIDGGRLDEVSSPLPAFVGTVTPDARSVSVVYATGPYWTVTLAAPAGSALAIGSYQDAVRYPSDVPEAPGIDVSGDGRGCGTATGRFFVQELARRSDGTLARFAADFEQHCEDRPAALFGAVRFNSDVPVTRPCSDEDRDGKQDSTDVCPETPYGEAIDAAGCSLLQFCARFDTTTALGRRACRKARWKSDTPALRAADADCAMVGDTCVPKGEPSRPDDVLILNGQGDFVGGTLQRRFTRADGDFIARPNFDNGVTIFFDGFPDHFWGLDFAAPGRVLLTPGPYDDATRFPFQDPAVPGFDVFGDGRGCNILTGRFVVDDIAEVGPFIDAYGDPTGQVQRFTADFEQHCEGLPPALLGTIHYTRPTAFGLTCIDTDGDGENDATDACPDTPPGAPVDHAGCSREQFCEHVSPANTRRCRRAVWQNDSIVSVLPVCKFSRVTRRCEVAR